MWQCSEESLTDSILIAAYARANTLRKLEHDPLNADELWIIGRIALRIQTDQYGLSNSLHQLVQRFGLGMASAKVPGR